MTEKKKLKLSKVAFGLSIGVFSLSLGLKFYLCNSITIKNGEFEQMSLRKLELEKEVEDLMVEEYSLSSIETIEERSKELGFIEMSERLVAVDLDAPIQVALSGSGN